MRFAARRARNVAWLHVYRDRWWTIWRDTQGDYGRTNRNAYLLAGLARVCQRRGRA